MSEELKKAMVNLEDDEVIKLVEKQLDERNPIEIFNDLKEALTKIGNLFEDKEYFLSDLIISADIFKEANKLIEPHFNKKVEESKGKIVIGTVEGDMHDIGKNIMIILLKSEGYEVIDLGIDTPPKKFLEAVKENEPNVLGLSGLLTVAKEPMKTTIKLIKENYKKPLVIIVGGVAINEDWINDVQADYGVTNAVTGLKLINQSLK